MSGRERAPNYTSEEKVLALSIISEYKHIIECKKTDTVTWRDKEAAWTEITNKFNATSPNLVKRTKHSIQKFYENKKKEVRKSVANDRTELFKTGGGKPIHSVEDPTKELVLGIINKKTVTGLVNSFDGDHNIIDIPQSTISSPCEIIQDVPITYISEETQNNNKSVPSNSSAVDWGNYKATQLNIPVSRKLKSVSAKNNENWTERRRPTKALHSSHLSQQYSDLASVKLELAIMQKEAFIADTKKRQDREEIEFELKKQSLELDIEIKKMQLKNLM